MADPGQTEHAVEVHDLRKSYGSHQAVKGISFAVEHGEVFGFLGTNGAGKTTTIEILEGYRRRSGGEASVLGSDPQKPTRAWRDRIGLVLQESELDPTLTVDETVDLVGLAEKRDAHVGTLSGGAATAGRRRRRHHRCCSTRSSRAASRRRGCRAA